MLTQLAVFALLPLAALAVPQYDYGGSGNGNSSPSSSKSSTAAAAAATPSISGLKVTVGNGNFTFNPPNTVAKVGDTVTFVFTDTIPHTVTQMDPANVCQPLSNGFGTAQINPSASDPTIFQLNVTTTDPIYVFCQVPTHCTLGLVGAINDNGRLTNLITQAKAFSGNEASHAPALIGSGASALASPTAAPLSSASGSPSSPAPSAGGSSSGSMKVVLGNAAAALAVIGAGAVMML